VDGVWSAIGSTNFDDRSFETNDEITLAVLDEKLTGELDAVFEKYVKRAEQIDLDRWRHRPAFHKAVDNAFYVFKSFF
jgi:cardiolipin synthase